MRIIAGTARSIPVISPPGMAVRPTADRAREALFNSLGDFDGIVVWDLYAGSGALGLESGSRGASVVTFVEQDATHCTYIQRNIDKVTTAIPNLKTQIINRSVSGISWQGKSPDLILADPPYPDSFEEFKLLLSNPGFCRFAANARLVWEIPDTPGILGEFLRIAPRQRFVRRFGGVNFLLINKIEELV